MDVREDIGLRFIQVSEQILTASRNELYMDQHYLALALGGLEFSVTTQLDGVGTDGEHLVVHPKVLAELFQKNRLLVNRIYLHQVYHCLFRHIFKRIRLKPEYWMVACDIAVELLIDSQNKRSTRTPRSRFRENVREELSKSLRVLNAEGIYHVLTAGPEDPARLLRLQQEFCVDNHSLWPAWKLDEKHPKLPPRSMILKKKWDDISNKTQTDMESFSAEAASGGGDLLEETKVENRERYEYRSFLRKFAAIREEMHIDMDSWDSILYSLGLEMYGNMPLIEPVETREVKKIDEFVIVIDTSMSVSGRLVHSFLEQTYSVLSEAESYLHKVNIRILQCDEEVLSDVKITSQEELEEYMDHFRLLGEGGTDFRPAFEYVEKLILENEFQDLRGLLYFTDGKGIYPKKRPPFETAFIFCEESCEASQVPPWAIRLILPREDLEVDSKEMKDARFIWAQDEV